MTTGHPVLGTIITELGGLAKAGIAAWANRPPKESSAPALKKMDSVPSQTSTSGILLPTREQTTEQLKRRLAKELYKAELDLAEGLMIAGRPCDCISQKHSLEFEAACEELIAQDPDNKVYQEIKDWMRDNLYKCTPEAITSGKYKSEYPQMALLFKEFRKRVLGTYAEKTKEPSIAEKPSSKISYQQLLRDIKQTWGTSEYTRTHWKEMIEKEGYSAPDKLPWTEEDEKEITLEEAQEIAAQEARERVKKKWTAQK